MTTPETVANPFRKALSSAISSICYEIGFTSVERTVLETLTEMLQSCLTEIARSSRAFCELTGRTEVLAGDVIVALVEMGISIDPLFAYAKRPTKISLPAPPPASRTSTPKILQAGERCKLPTYIPEHYPTFPDPHAYIRTPTHKQPVTEYEAIREKAASQKRDVERALTRFVAKTGATQSLFPDDNTLFPLIACKSVPNPYLMALLPKDQVFDNEEDSNNSLLKSKGNSGDIEDPSGQSNDIDMMDNPYLRPAKMLRKRKR